MADELAVATATPQVTANKKQTVKINGGVTRTVELFDALDVDELLDLGAGLDRNVDRLHLDDDLGGQFAGRADRRREALQIHRFKVSQHSHIISTTNAESTKTSRGLFFLRCPRAVALLSRKFCAKKKLLKNRAPTIDLHLKVDLFEGRRWYRATKRYQPP